MRVSVFGLGYVGCVTVACLANNGHKVIGIDINTNKIRLINSRQATIVEKDVDDLIRVAVNNGNLIATNDFHRTIIESDVSLICVGTPSNTNGSINLRYVEKVCRQIGTLYHSNKTTT